MTEPGLSTGITVLDLCPKWEWNIRFRKFKQLSEKKLSFIFTVASLHFLIPAGEEVGGNPNPRRLLMF